MTPLDTDHLTLLRCTLAHLRGLLESNQAFESAFGLRVAEDFIEFPGALDFAAAKLAGAEADAQWWAPFLFVHRADRAVVGIGGCKGPPDAAGVVEIGYSIAPAYRGRGLATEAARALVEHAFTFAEVREVCAHTLPEPNASNRILTKAGFRFAGEVTHPEDGRIWRWERTR